MIAGSPWRWAISAIRRKSGTSFFGLPSVSRYTARVFLSTRLLMVSGLRGSKNRTSTPSLAKVWVNRVHVPPYRLLAEMKFCPAWMIVNSAAVMAAMPLPNTNPPAPPSRAASRFSSTSFVGFINRL